jgi:endothelin-converting enzyme/putative endopeptidase
MKLFFALPLLAASFAMAQTKAPNAQKEEEIKLDHFDPKMVDSSVDPCTDFFHYACNVRIKNSPMPPDEIFWGSFSKIAKWNDEQLHKALDEIAAKKTGRTPNEQKIGDYYRACMDEKKLDADGVNPIKADLAMVESLRSTTQLASLMAMLHTKYRAAWLAGDNQTGAPMFGFGQTPDYNDAQSVVAMVDQAGLGLPNRDFYLNNDEKSTKIRADYVAHIIKMLQFTGESEAQAKADADKILKLEMALATVQMDNISRRDPKNLNNRYTLAQLKSLTPSFNWDTYMKAVGAPAIKMYIVTSPKFFTALEEQIKQQPLDVWKAYLRWNVIHRAADYLSPAIELEDFNFYDKSLYGQQELAPRWRRCANRIDRDLGEALGQAYVQRAFSPESKARAKQLVEDIKQALGRDIDSIDWMQPQTKQAAHAKLAAMLDKIGYPDKWRDYSALRIATDSYLANVQRSTTFEFKRQLNKIGKPLDRYEWTMTPPTVNAYEDPQYNTINFPAGILQPPFFDAQMSDTVNYAAIGAVIGHEIIHGFDDQGRKFDKDGNLRDWWTEADAKAYDQRGDCVAEEYTQMVPEAGVKQNGRLTQGEDTADNGGIHLALSATEAQLKRKGKTLDTKGDDGLTNLQRFFLSYATIWCGEIRPEAIRTIVLTNPHSIDRYRVNNVVANMPEFAQAFSCKPGQSMVHEKKCRVW